MFLWIKKKKKKKLNILFDCMYVHTHTYCQAREKILL